MMVVTYTAKGYQPGAVLAALFTEQTGFDTHL